MKLVRAVSPALVAYLLVAPATSGMLVLCFGNDGHVAVEAASADRCCREWETAHHDARDGGPSTTMRRGSGPCCSDVQLSVESVALTKPSHKVAPASALPAAVPIRAEPLCPATTRTIPLAAESPIASSLRTVVLRA